MVLFLSEYLENIGSVLLSIFLTEMSSAGSSPSCSTAPDPGTPVTPFCINISLIHFYLKSSDLHFAPLTCSLQRKIGLFQENLRKRKGKIYYIIDIMLGLYLHNT